MAMVASATVMISVSAHKTGSSFRTCCGGPDNSCRDSRMAACSRTGSMLRATAGETLEGQHVV